MKAKRFYAIMLVFVLMVSSVSGLGNAGLAIAAKKPKLNYTSLSLYQGKKKTLVVKNKPAKAKLGQHQTKKWQK